MLIATAAQTQQLEHTVKIRITTVGKSAIAVLDDSATSRDFLTMLPLKLVLEDYASIEKVSDLPKKLSIDGQPTGMQPSEGDFTYYAPWGNLAIFLKSFNYSTGLVKFGCIESGLELIRQSGPIPITIERMAD
jgi:hypothetical protein